MKLQTTLTIPKAQKAFGYRERLLFLGSCFAENIGAKARYYKFDATVNPFGILFHPIAVENVIEAAVQDKTFTEADVFELDGIWKSYDAHSDLNALSQLEAVIQLQEAQAQLRTALLEASHIFITLGTAWVYEHLERGKIVANCHKVPQKHFRKRLLSAQEVEQSVSSICQLIDKLNPEAKITFTVSPVRHIKDGIVENTQSKANLLTAVHQVSAAQHTSYFPAYELMMDELRDYRFYAADMVHPSAQAIDYIWERFLDTYAFAKALETYAEVKTILQALAHRPFNAESEAHLVFVEKLEKRIAKLQGEFPVLRFDD